MEKYKPFFGDTEVISSNGLGEVTLNIGVSGSLHHILNLALYTQKPAGFRCFPIVIPLTYMNDYIRRDFVETSGDKEYTLTQEFNTSFR